MKKELSVIVPAFNEEAEVAGTLSETADYLRAKGYAFELIVLNDGSVDRTAEKVRPLLSRYPEIRLLDHPENRGKGERVKEGIALARHPLCLFMDADDSTSIREWEKFEALFEKGYDAVVASRHLPASRIVRPQPRMRRFLGGGYRFLCRRWLGLSASDPNCGFKAYRTEFAKRVYAESRMRDWTFDAEIFCLMKKYGARFAEVPVEWSYKSKRSSTTFLAPIVTAFKMLGSLARIWKRFSSEARPGSAVEWAFSLWLVAVSAAYLFFVVYSKLAGKI